MLVTILSGFVVAALSPWFARRTGAIGGWLLSLLPVALFIYFARHIENVAAGVSLREAYSWVPTLGINLSFHVDGLALVFGLLITGVGALVLIYAGGYLAGHQHLGRLYAYLLMFMASMLGVVLADNAITLFVFWELTSFSSYLLIGFDHERETARTAALQALLVTGLGGLALLAGLLLLGLVGGSFEFSELAVTGDTVRGHALYLPILLLVLAGAFTKSAQFPFHFWLPSAMQAPTPVSAYLHSATMVKAGVYLLARLSPVLGGTPSWQLLVTIAGAATLLVGSVLAVRQTDLKLLLAYSTVAALGALVALLGIGTEAAAEAAIVFLVAHALYKGSLFLVAGAVDHETGTRDIDKLGGLWRSMPITGLAAGLAALSMAGIPPMFGFLAKELFYGSVLEGPWAIALTAAAVAGSAFFVVVAGMTGIGPFFGRPMAALRDTHEASVSLWLGPLVLALGGFVGLWPGLIDSKFLGPAAAAIVSVPVSLHLELWHGWSPALFLSVVTVVIGIGLFVTRARVRSIVELGDAVSRWGPARWYTMTMDGLHEIARAQTRVLQNGYLRYYLLSVLAVLVGLVITTGVRNTSGGLSLRLIETDATDVRFYEAGLVALIVPASLLAVLSQSRFASIAGLGMVGYCVALLFVLFGAPDLAMTQFLIETLTVILFVLVFYHLPVFAQLSSGASRLRDMVVAMSVGVLMTVLVLVAGRVQVEEPISGYYAELSEPAAHGRNIVNVILVDFRGLDTLGEITVLAVAAIGVYALLKLRLAGRKSS